MEDLNMEVRTHYPYSEIWDYTTELELINFDEERIRDLSSGNGFFIRSAQSTKIDQKSEYSIYSSKYGQTLQDVNPYANRYRCKCGHTTSKIYYGLTCPVCGTKVEFVGDNFKYTGWIVLKDGYYLIHPNVYKSLEALIGEEELNDIIGIKSDMDEDGHEIKKTPSKNHPFAGIGMMEFRERFDEIINFYALKKPNKRDYWEDIISKRDKVFTGSVPVYTTHLRPYQVEDKKFSFEGTNAIYNMMSRLASNINNDKYEFTRKKKPKNQLLADMQGKWNKLYNTIVLIMSGKKGNFRTAFGGRVNFTARSVITPPDGILRIDEIGLSYYALCGLLQQSIINILHKGYNMTYNGAYKFLCVDCAINPNPIIINIIEGIIRDRGGIPVLINRNPTINFGSILYARVVKITKGFTMQINLQTLSGLGADFDGDTLNIMYIINEEFRKACDDVFNPRNNMYISKNDGWFNNAYNHQRDTLININTMLQLSRGNYTQDQLNKIKSAIDS